MAKFLLKHKKGGQYKVNGRPVLFVDSPEKIDRAIKILESARKFGVDVEGYGCDIEKEHPYHKARLISHQYSASGPKVDDVADASLIFVPHWGPYRRQLKYFRPILEDDTDKKCLHGAKYDMHVFANEGIELRGLKSDTMVKCYLENTADLHGLKPRVRKHLGLDDVPDFRATFAVPVLKKDGTPGKRMILPQLNEALSGKYDYAYKPRGGVIKLLVEYGVKDPYYTVKIDDKMDEILGDMQWHGSKSMLDYYNMVERDFTYILYDMERRGCKVDVEMMTLITEQVKKKAIEVEQTFLNTCVKMGVSPSMMQDFNIGSNVQLGNLLQDKLGIELPRTKPSSRNPNGQAQVGSEILEKVRGHRNQRLVSFVLEYRKLTKLVGTYFEPFLAIANEDWSGGRLRTQFKHTGTRTMRLACVSADTKLETSHGTFRIDQLDLQKVPGCSIITHKGRMRRITDVFLKGYDHMYEVTLRSGETIKVTKDHRFYSNGTWIKFRDLGVGDEVVRHHRGSVSSDIRTGGLVHKTGAREVRDIEDAVLPMQGIPDEVPIRTEGAVFSEICGFKVREYLREEGAAIRTIRQGSTSQRIAAWDACRSDSSESKRFGLLGEAEHRVPQVGGSTAKSRQGLAQASEGVQPRHIAEVGCDSTRTDGRGSSVLRGSSEVCGPSVPSAFADHGSALVCKEVRHQTSSHYRYESLLEDQQVRGCAGPGAGGLWVGVHQGGSYREVLCRLSDWRGADSGGGRRIPHPVCGEGRGFGSPGKEARVPSTSGYYPSGLDEYQGCDGFDSQEIVTVRYLGIQEVWDLSVEEDHSYVAQGFVNHNSATPNLQNVPRPDEDDPEGDPFGIRKAFIPDNPVTDCLGDADLANIELRLMAHMSKDKEMIKAFNEGWDMHARTAVVCFKQVSDYVQQNNNGVLDSDILAKIKKEFKTERQGAKTVSFLVAYGGGPQRYAATTGTSIQEGKRVIAGLFSGYSGLKRGIDKAIAECHQNGHVRTLLRRYVHIPEIHHHDVGVRAGAERKAWNYKIQGGAGELLKLAMVLIYRDDKLKYDLGVDMNLQVHDELLFNMPIETREEAKPIIEDYISHPYRYFGMKDLLVDTPAELGFGPNWSEAK